MEQYGDLEFEDLDPKVLELNQILDKIDIVNDTLKASDFTKVQKQIESFEADIKKDVEDLNVAGVSFYSQLKEVIVSKFQEETAYNQLSYDKLTESVSQIFNKLTNMQEATALSFLGINDSILVLNNAIKMIQELIINVNNENKVMMFKYFADLPLIETMPFGKLFFVSNFSFKPFKLSGLYKVVENKKNQKVYKRV